MAEEENQNQGKVVEEQVIQLVPPVPLDDQSLKVRMIEDIAANNPEYMAEVAIRHKLDLQQDLPAVMDKVYEEQLSVVSETCIANALDENTIESYNLLQKLCYFSQEELAYMKAVEGDELSTNIVSYVEERLKGVSELAPILAFTKDVNEAILYSTADYPNFTSYKANQLKEKMDGTVLKLSDDEKGKLNFIASKMYRKLSAQSSPLSDNVPGVQETECLRKALRLSSDYKLIAYCQNRLPGASDDKHIIRAYKNALTKKQSRSDMYHINAELANLYLKRTKKVGFMCPNSEKGIAAEKSIKYLLNAYRYADKDDRLHILKKVADVHLLTGNVEGWSSIKEVIAMKLLKGEERCFALSAIGDKTGDLSFYQKALEECEKARMQSSSKLYVQEATYTKIVQKAKDSQMREDAMQQLQTIKDKRQQEYSRLLNKKQKSL